MAERMPRITNAKRCEPGTRVVEVARIIPPDHAVSEFDEIGGQVVVDRVELRPYRQGSTRAKLFAGYHEPSDQWFIAE